jgi:hypothetical protein
MAPRTLLRRRVFSAWRRLHREEEGIALVLVIVSMLVLTLALTTVMFMTAAGARDARILDYADSGDVSGDKSTVVGYLAAALGRFDEPVTTADTGDMGRRAVS